MQSKELSIQDFAIFLITKKKYNNLSTNLSNYKKSKLHNFAFKNSNIVIQGIIQTRKDYFLYKKHLKQRKIMYLKNFIF